MPDHEAILRVMKRHADRHPEHEHEFQKVKSFYDTVTGTDTDTENDPPEG